MKRSEFMFSIGYSGKNAVVDKKAMAQYGNLSGAELTEKGLYRAAFASAVFSGDESEMNAFIDAYSKASGRKFASKDDLSRVFGVFPATDVKVTLL